MLPQEWCPATPELSALALCALLVSTMCFTHCHARAGLCILVAGAAALQWWVAPCPALHYLFAWTTATGASVAAVLGLLSVVAVAAVCPLTPAELSLRAAQELHGTACRDPGTRCLVCYAEAGQRRCVTPNCAALYCQSCVAEVSQARAACCHCAQPWVGTIHS